MVQPTTVTIPSPSPLPHQNAKISPANLFVNNSFIVNWFLDFIIFLTWIPIGLLSRFRGCVLISVTSPFSSSTPVSLLCFVSLLSGVKVRCHSWVERETQFTFRWQSYLTMGPYFCMYLSMYTSLHIYFYWRYVRRSLCEDSPYRYYYP